MVKGACKTAIVTCADDEYLDTKSNKCIKCTTLDPLAVSCTEAEGITSWCALRLLQAFGLTDNRVTCDSSDDRYALGPVGAQKCLPATAGFSMYRQVSGKNLQSATYFKNVVGRPPTVAGCISLALASSASIFEYRSLATLPSAAIACETTLDRTPANNPFTVTSEQTDLTALDDTVIVDFSADKTKTVIASFLRVGSVLVVQPLPSLTPISTLAGILVSAFAYMYKVTPC